MARGGFLIEGGMAEVGPDSSVTFLAEFDFQIFDVDGMLIESPSHSEGFRLSRGSTGNGHLERSGIDGDLGATFDGVRRVNVPLAFREFDIGVVPPMGYVTFDFRFDAVGVADPTGDASATWRYADPLSIDDPGGPSPAATVTFVPEPATAGLCLAAAALLARRRAR
jgi:hypothetical protein